MDALADAGHGEVDADAAGGGDEDEVFVESELSGSFAGHRFGVLEAFIAGAGVGVSRVNDDGLGCAVGDAFHADFDGCGADLVGGEHACGRGGGGGSDDGEVAFWSFGGAFAGAEALDIAEDTCGGEAFGCEDGAGDGSEGVGFHGRGS